MESSTTYSFEYILDDYKKEYQQWSYFSHIQTLNRDVLYAELQRDSTAEERKQDIKKILSDKDVALLRAQESARSCEKMWQNLSSDMSQIESVRGSDKVVGEVDKALRQVPRVALDLSAQYENVSNYTLNTRIRQMCKTFTPMNEDGEPLPTTQRWVVGPAGHTIDIMGREVQAFVETMASVTDLFADAEIREKIHLWIDEWADRDDELGMLAFALLRIIPHREDYDDPQLESAPVGTLLTAVEKKQIDLQKSLDRFLEKINTKSLREGKKIRVTPCLINKTNIWHALKQYEQACGLRRFATFKEVKVYKTTKKYEIHLSVLPKVATTIERVKRYIRESVMLNCDKKFVDLFHKHMHTLSSNWTEAPDVACILNRYLVGSFDPKKSHLPDLLVDSLKQVIEVVEEEETPGYRMVDDVEV